MRYDVLVIGAGVTGLSSAYHLKRRFPTKRVVVIDMHDAPGQGNTARSNACFRNVFASETNYLLADSTIDWFHHLQEGLGHALKLTYFGYLWLYSEAQHSRMRGALKKIRGRGVDLRDFERRDLGRMIPDLKTGGWDEAEELGLEPVDVGVFGSKCGSLDANALVRAYESEYLRIGGEVRYGTTAERLVLKPEEELGLPGEPFVWQDTRVVGAETSAGVIEAETTVVAADAWSERLLTPVGIDPLMRPKKRQIFVFRDPRIEGLVKVRGFNSYDILPMTILPKAGVHIRVEMSEGSIWLGCADSLGRGFGLEDDTAPEPGYYTNNIYHLLVKYFPCFEDVRPVNMWAGQYAINSFDEIPVVVPSPGMIYVGATSGSGIMKCDTLGRIVAALEAGEKEAELYGGRRFRVADIGVKARKVQRETFVL